MEDLAHSMDFCSINNHHRTIIHIDMDCFYAQVEMLKNPALRQCPMGVQQKNIIVTSNYIARDFGIEKCMLVTEGLKLCPQLVLVHGEDLQDYRQMSAKVTNLLYKYSPLVEKLGLDENFIDISSLVADRLEEECCNKGVEGFVYGDLNEKCECGCRNRLCIGSNIASEMRNDIKNVLGLTCCAGVAHNKLLAKLVSGTFKPNQQTTIFPCSAMELLSSLKSVRGIPGVGYRMHETLQSLCISNVADLRNCNLSCLQKALGYETAIHIKKLSYGIDDSPVKPSGKPQSIGLEDGFRKICLQSEVKDKLNILLQRLLKLLSQDGRMPGSIKVTVRKYDVTKKYSHRESRQCNVPPSIFKNKSESISPKAVEKLMDLMMQLFYKMIDISKPFHLTLLGVAFTKFQERKTGKSSIASFLTNDISVQSVLNLKNVSEKTDKIEHASTSSQYVSMERCSSESELEPSPKKTRMNELFSRGKKRSTSEENESSPNKRLSDGDSGDSVMSQCGNSADEITLNSSDLFQCPQDVDKSVFNALPQELKNELIEEWRLDKSVTYSGSQSKILHEAKPRQKSIVEFFISK